MDLMAWRTLGFCTLGIWIYLASFRGGFWRLRERLGTGRPVGNRTVTAIIPARDESEFIGRAVASLHAQRGAGLVRVIVADDESTDDTGPASHADLVVSVDARPRGWKGKLWALACGIKASENLGGPTPEYYLLTDADIEHVSHDLLSSLIAQAERGFDLVSVMVQLRCESTAEQLLIPAFVFFFFKLYPPRWVSNGKGAAAAAGGCMLIRREMLTRIGGIETIRDALIDDCALAAHVRAREGRVWMGISELTIRSIRPYGGASGIRSMIARSAFAQLRHSALLLPGTVAGMFLTYIAPAALLFSHDVVATAAGITAWVLGGAIYLPTIRLYRAGLWTAACLPAIAAFYLVATIESAVRYRSGRGGLWKGRAQDVS
jgi:hopene-associated glycosyltransferase HpnB